MVRTGERRHEPAGGPAGIATALRDAPQGRRTLGERTPLLEDARATTAGRQPGDHPRTDPVTRPDRDNGVADQRPRRGARPLPAATCRSPDIADIAVDHHFPLLFQDEKPYSNLHVFTTTPIRA